MKIHLRNLIMFALLVGGTLEAAEYHVAKDGDDANPGTALRPFATIMAAAAVAQPGDTITVSAGTYREQIDPPRGGTGPEQRITYRAAPGERVMIKGSERIREWEKVRNSTWKATVPNSIFGDFNPYADVLSGDWYLDRGRDHHTGAVYLDGHWLVEAAHRDEVLAPFGKLPAWAGGNAIQYLFNILEIRTGEDAAARNAADFREHKALRPAKGPDGQPIIGWIEDGAWVKYSELDFGDGAESLTLLAATPYDGGMVEIRMDDPFGEILGTAAIPSTGNWQNFQPVEVNIRKVHGERNLCFVFKKQSGGGGNDGLWHADVGADTTTIWAQFDGIDPNEADVEINVRQSVFYPSRPGIDYITVSGFTMHHAATPWAPPTAEQIALLGTHWSKGWIIENNDIAYSICTGISLGKYGDEWDNHAATAEAYVDSIRRAYEDMGWRREDIGSHIVRDNRVSHCEMAGINGSMGAAFSQITGNTIHDIHMRRYFSGAEIGGIKFHAPIDTLIADNHIYNCARGMWLDWMTQGTRVTRNLFHDNPSAGDLLVELNHGPFLIDNNIFLSSAAVLDQSQGGAFVHNLIAGEIRWVQVTDDRKANVLKPHSTTTVAVEPISGGDTRYYNNIFIGGGLRGYDRAGGPLFTGNNVYLGGNLTATAENEAHVYADFMADLVIERQDQSWNLSFKLPPEVAEMNLPLIKTEDLGKASISGQAYVDTDGSDVTIAGDYFNEARSKQGNAPGPFRELKAGRNDFEL